MIAKFRYHRENLRHREFKFSLCTVIFAMIAKFCYHSEKLCIAKFRRDCEIFAMVAKFSLCHSENRALPALPPTSVQPPFLHSQLLQMSYRLQYGFELSLDSSCSALSSVRSEDGEVFGLQNYQNTYKLLLVTQ